MVVFMTHFVLITVLVNIRWIKVKDRILIIEILETNSPVKILNLDVKELLSNDW